MAAGVGIKGNDMDKEMEDLNNSLPLIMVPQKELDVLQAEIDAMSAGLVKAHDDLMLE